MRPWVVHNVRADDVAETSESKWQRMWDTVTDIVIDFVYAVTLLVSLMAISYILHKSNWLHVECVDEPSAARHP